MYKKKKTSGQTVKRGSGTNRTYLRFHVTRGGYCEMTYRSVATGTPPLASTFLRSDDTNITINKAISFIYYRMQTQVLPI